MGSTKDVKKIEDELTWIYNDPSLPGHTSEKGIFSYLVALGCFVTAGVLASGVYQFYKGDSKKQQILMRRRVLAQGITVGFALGSLFFSPNLRERFSRWG